MDLRFLQIDPFYTYDISISQFKFNITQISLYIIKRFRRRRRRRVKIREGEGVGGGGGRIIPSPPNAGLF